MTDPDSLSTAAASSYKARREDLSNDPYIRRARIFAGDKDPATKNGDVLPGGGIDARRSTIPQTMLQKLVDSPLAIPVIILTGWLFWACIGKVDTMIFKTGNAMPTRLKHILLVST
ncbi:hypothetical protein HDU93_006528 [Gonapodya sp. JEL0774]|nr:hypothetical protein HDU93_006528 [Gonapodya sp. JEL0774]